MEILLLDVQSTSQESQYMTTVLVDDSVYQFVMTVNDTPAPMLTILGDEHFYEVLGRDYDSYRPLLEKLGAYHLNGDDLSSPPTATLNTMEKLMPFELQG